MDAPHCWPRRIIALRPGGINEEAADVPGIATAGGLDYNPCASQNSFAFVVKSTIPEEVGSMSDSKCLILYVDDHEDSSEMLRLILADSDYEVHTAHNIDEALMMATQESYDLYVLDKRLPDGSGLELVRRLNEMTPSIPSIVYTGDAYEIHREQALAAGAKAYVAKPDIDKLIETVHGFLSQKEATPPANRLV